MLGDKPIRVFSPPVIVVLVLLLAAAARLHQISDRAVWTDEGYTAWATLDRRVDDVLDVLRDDRHPPLFFLALNRWENVAGDSRLALRFLSVLGGIVTTAVVYRIGTDWFSAEAGLYAASFYAVLGIAVYYDQEIRHYGWLTLAVSLMSLFFLRYLHRPRTRWLVWYALSVAMMLSTNYFGLTILALQAALGLVIWRGSRRDKARLLGAWAAAALLCAPLMVSLFATHLRKLVHAASAPGVPFSLEPTWDNFWVIVALLLGYQTAMMAGAYLLGAGGIVRRADRRSADWLARAYMLGAGGGLFIVMFVASVQTPTLTPRTLVFLTPMLVLVSGYGLSRIPWPARGVFAGVLVVAMLIYTHPIQPRLNYGETARSLAAAYSPGDLIVLETGWDDNAFWYELKLALPDPDPAIIRTLPWVEQGQSNLIRPVIPQIEESLRAARRVWVVQWLQAPVVVPFLDDGAFGFRRVIEQQTPVGDAYLAEYPSNPVIDAVLFERPDLTSRARQYQDLFVLHDVVVSGHAHAGEDLQVDLWWSAQQALDRDYSVGVYLMRAEADSVVAQHDGPPGDIPTSQWRPASLVFDRHTLDLPDDLPPGTYRLAVSVYWFGDPAPLVVDGAPYAFVAQVIVG